MSFLFLSRGILTRAEAFSLLVVLVIFGAVGYAPLMRYLESRRIAHSVESAQTISTLLFQYATDNEGVYPVGDNTTAVGTSEGIARNLLANNYTPDPGIFALGSTPRYSGKAADFADFTAQNISWDFTAGINASTGITTAAPDALPVVYSTGENVSFPVGTGLDLRISGHGPFADKGVVVAYKDNSAKFILAVVTETSVVSPSFVSKSLPDSGPHVQIKP